MPSENAGRDETIRSVDRALSVLQVIAEGGAAGVSEIAEATGTHKSTVFRLLATLEARGMVEQTHQRGQYALGYGVVQLARAATRRHDLSVLSRPVCEQLAETVGETVNVSIHDGTGVITLDQHIGPAAVTTVDWVGTRAPLHASAAGKVFLAYAPAGELTASGRLERFTEHTITRQADLRAELAGVRRLGHAASLEEQEDGLIAVAAPVRELGGAVVAALVVSGPTFRLTEAARPDVVKQLVEAAAEISYRNGVPKPG
ncbi:IclR family transcriptional regulator [soil metagenome]